MEQDKFTTREDQYRGRFFCDMDGVLADYEKCVRATGLSGKELKMVPGVFAKLDPMPGALEGIRSIIDMGFDVFIATKPASGRPGSYSEKVTWVMQHLPELRKKIIMTQDKGLLGGRGDWLLDDRPHVANCGEFPGEVLHFGGPLFPTWADVVSYMGTKRWAALET